MENRVTQLLIILFIFLSILAAALAIRNQFIESDLQDRRISYQLQIQTLDRELEARAAEKEVLRQTKKAGSSTSDDATAIKIAVSKKIGKAESELVIQISKQTSKHAKGFISAKDETGGGYWLATKTDNGWIVVYDGQATPNCNEIDSYEFPTDMVPECLDDSGNVVER